MNRRVSTCRNICCFIHCWENLLGPFSIFPEKAKSIDFSANSNTLSTCIYSIKVSIEKFRRQTEKIRNNICNSVPFMNKNETPNLQEVQLASIYAQMFIILTHTTTVWLSSIKLPFKDVHFGLRFPTVSPVFQLIPLKLWFSESARKPTEKFFFRLSNSPS